VNEPIGFFTVQPTATWTSHQRLSQHTHLVITVRNAGTKTIPNVAVTICNVTCVYSPNLPVGEGTSVAAFAEYLDQPYLASHSRPVWIVDHPPGPCTYSCSTGGPGGAVSAYSNTWALGALAPGQTVTFDWGLTAVRSGSHTVAWEVAAGLNGKARAVLPDGSQPQGTFTVNVSRKPAISYVNDKGQIITTG
jgi:hypothetical protein